MIRPSMERLIRPSESHDHLTFSDAFRLLDIAALRLSNTTSRSSRNRRYPIKSFRLPVSIALHLPSNLHLLV